MLSEWHLVNEDNPQTVEFLRDALCARHEGYKDELALKHCTVTGRQAFGCGFEPRQEVLVSSRRFGSHELIGGSPTCVNEGLTWEECMMRVKQRTQSLQNRRLF